MLVTCNNCGTELAEEDASTSMIGWLCPECAAARPASADLEQTYRNGALYSAVCAAVSWFFNPFAVLSIAAAILAMRTLSLPTKLDEDERAPLQQMPWVKWVAAGSALAALAPLAAKAAGSLMAM
ncbi:hypothetical protein FIV42_10540 [Persicimonas caeni]|uniref:Uncharacterized protein n=1 Tax=Persicimonas caeni TaxID=2292766 RepID=A0A4Y6PS65_PERCE|nr:hypothetical protein [Persicimonas caeni]QDG51158.1 hypothetical protein FIV42_10540 [Persicimonas caeni]QED32379.1 hypothetical protein FRD00_10535 [Persicimonas caeni]